MPAPQKQGTGEDPPAVSTASPPTLIGGLGGNVSALLWPLWPASGGAQLWPSSWLTGATQQQSAAGLCGCSPRMGGQQQRQVVPGWTPTQEGGAV